MLRNIDEGMPPTEDIERLRYEAELDRRGSEQYQQNVLQRARPRNSRTRQPSRAPTHTSPTTSASRSPTARSHPLPTELGSTMRHIRRPQPREIERKVGRHCCCPAGVSRRPGAVWRAERVYIARPSARTCRADNGATCRRPSVSRACVGRREQNPFALVVALYPTALKTKIRQL